MGMAENIGWPRKQLVFGPKMYAAAAVGAAGADTTGKQYACVIAGELFTLYYRLEGDVSRKCGLQRVLGFIFNVMRNAMSSWRCVNWLQIRR